MNVTDLPLNMQTKIRVTEPGCWEWTGALNSRGYGQVAVLGVSKSTHRVAYQLLVGPIPDRVADRSSVCAGLQHGLFRHLEPVTQIENMQRRPDVNKERCVNGHEMTAENTLTKRHKGGSGKIRNCRECQIEAQREHRRRNPRALPRNPLTVDDPRHGTLSGYTNHKCRCDECRSAAREYAARRKQIA